MFEKKLDKAVGYPPISSTTWVITSHFFINVFLIKNSYIGVDSITNRSTNFEVYQPLPLRLSREASRAQNT